MKLDLKTFNKVHSDSDHSIFKHKSGHEIKIAHKGLDAKARGELASIPHMDQGGEVNPNLPPNFNELTQQEQQRLAVNAGVPGAVLGPGEPKLSQEQLNPYEDRAQTNVAGQYIEGKEKKAQKESDQSQLAYEKEQADLESQNAIRAKAGLPLLHGTMSVPQEASITQSYQPESGQGIKTIGYGPTQSQYNAPNSDEYGYGQELNTYQQGAGQYQKGLQQQAQAEMQQGKDRADYLKQNIQAQQQMQTDFQDHVSQINNEREALFRDLQNQHVSPDHYWEDKSSVGKIASAVGLLVGGIGAGATGSENMAMKFINNQIDRDMEAQKLNISNKQSLLNANRQRFQDEVTANNATRLMKNDMLSHQLDLAAANSTDMNAKARLNAASGQFKMQSASIVQQMAMRQTMLKGLQNPGLDPATKIRQMVMTGILKPEQEQHAVKELTDVENVKNAAGDIMNAFHAANQENTVAGRTKHLGAEPASVGIMENMLLPLIKDREGRVNEFDFATTRKFIPRPGDGPYKIAAKEAGLKQWLTQKGSHPMLHGLGIDIPILPKEYKMGAPVNASSQVPRNPIVNVNQQRKPNG